MDNPSPDQVPGSQAPADMTNEQIRMELSTIATVLHDDAPHDLGPLVQRREELRNEVRSRPATPADVDALKRELVGLQKRLGIIEDERINPAGFSGPTDIGEIKPDDGQQIAWAYDDATGKAAIQSRIDHIRRRLADAEQ